jgi:hypothetical protein
MKSTFLKTASLLLLSSFSVLGQPFKFETKNGQTEIRGFIENKGQIADQDGRMHKDLLFLYVNDGFKLQLKSNSFSYEVYRHEMLPDNEVSMEESDGIQLHPDFKIVSHRVDISLKGANPFPQVISEGRSKDFSNYYLAHTGNEGIREVHSYKRVTYKNIYPLIDLVFSANSAEGHAELKYDFIVHAGGRVSDIQMEYTGAEGLSLDENEQLNIETTVGELRETIPYSFSKGTGENTDTPVKVRFLLSDNLVSFHAEKYDNSVDLVIDPLILMGSYYGGTTSTEFGYETGIDDSLNTYICGNTGGSSSFASSGAHQVTFGGSWDAFLGKLDADGKRRWGTYYGGSEAEDGYGLFVTKNGLSFITGNTQSTTGIASTGAHKTTLTSVRNAFVAGFDQNGTRLWGTYLGGTVGEQGRGITGDNKNSIYITGGSNSTTGISTSGTHQPVMTGSNDAFIVKMTRGGVRIWGTYYGGSLVDWGNKMVLDSSCNIYLAGMAQSTDSIATAGTFQTVHGGGFWDGYIAKFDSNGQRKWASYFGGSGNDQAHEVALDVSGNIVIAGETVSSGLASSGAHQTSFGGGTNDGFIAKFDPAGNRLWSTYYGGTDMDICGGLGTDSRNNIFAGGHTQSSSGIASANSFQPSINVGTSTYDAFVVKFDSSGQRRWGTYLGGPGLDQLSDIKVQDDKKLLIGGTTTSTQDIATMGTFQTTYQGSFDAYALWFSPLDYAKLPPSSPTGLIFSKVTSSSMKLSWTKGQSRKTLVVVRTNSAAPKTPVMGHDYAADTVFGKAPLQPGNYVIYADTGNSVTVSGLSPLTEYIFLLYAFNDGADSLANYRIPGLPGNKSTLAAEPGVVSQNLLFSNVTENSMMLRWNKGDGAKRLVLAKAITAVDSFPADGTVYTANSSFGLGSDIGNGNYVVYSGTDSFFTVTQLLSATLYHFAVIEYNGSSTSTNYYTSAFLAGSRFTLAAEPLSASSGLVFTNVTSSAMDLSWTSGSGKNSIVVVREAAPVNKLPADATTYAADNIFGAGSDIDSGNFVVYKNNGNNFTLTGLNPSTIYYAAVFEMNGEGDSANYLVSTYLSGNRSTLAREPLTPPSGITFTDITTDSFTVSWNKGNGEMSMVLVKEGAAVDQVPADGNSYSASSTFAAGSQLGSGNYVTYQGSGNSYRQKGLLANTQYYVAVFEMNGSGDSSNYLTSAYSSDSSFTLATALITPAGPTTFCEGDSVLLNAKSSQGVSYIWKLEGSTIPGSGDTILHAMDSGNYVVEVTNSAGTNISAPLKVTVNHANVPVITILNPSSFYCQGDTVILQATADPGQLLWSNNDTLSIIAATQSGNYAVTVTDLDGCKATSASVPLTFNPTPANPVISQSGDTLISTSASGYQWNDTAGPVIGAVQRLFVPGTGGKYSVTVFDSSGCSANSQEFNYIKTGMDEEFIKPHIIIYPNPAEGIINIHFENFESMPCQVKITAITGQVLFKEEFPSGGMILQVNLESVSKGVYFLTVTQGDTNYVSRLLLH